MTRWCDRALVKAILPYTLCTTEQLYKKAVAQLGHKSVTHNEWLGEGRQGRPEHSSRRIPRQGKLHRL